MVSCKSREKNNRNTKEISNYRQNFNGLSIDRCSKATNLEWLHKNENYNGQEYKVSNIYANTCVQGRKDFKIPDPFLNYWMLYKKTNLYGLCKYQTSYKLQHLIA